MLFGGLQKVLVKICDPRNSNVGSDTRSAKFGVLRKLSALARVYKKRPQNTPPETPPVSKPPSLKIRNDTPVNYDHNCKSAINRLPHELLAEIFITICHADSDKFLGDRHRHRKTTPLILASVCTLWRAVSLSNPRIWSYVSLCLSEVRYEAQVELLREWFGHSGVCPLTINLVFQNEAAWTSVIPKELINLLAQHSSRWRSVNLVLPEAWYPLLEGVKDDLNLLRTVSTQPLWADCSLSPSKRKQLTLFERAPLLDDLHLNGYYLTDIHLRWSQLTRITLQHVYLDECFYALPLTPNLTWCRIYTILINDVNRPVVDPEKLIPLESLKRFIVYSAAWGDLMRLLSFISFPLLESFEVNALLDDLIFSQLSTSLLRATTEGGNVGGLTRLVLSELDFVSRPPSETELQLKAFFKEMPMLEELEIDVSKKADRERAALCVWWFVDILGIQSEVTGDGKEKGRSDMESVGEPGVMSAKEWVGGDKNEDGQKNTLWTTLYTKAIPTSNFEPPHSTSTEANSRFGSRSRISSHSSSYILPNLVHFTFSGQIIVARHTNLDTTADNDEDSLSAKRFHPPVRNEDEFPQALLDVLSARGGFDFEWWKEGVQSQPEIDRCALLDQDTQGDVGDKSQIYILDDFDNLMALPASALPGSSFSSTSASPTNFALPPSHITIPNLASTNTHALSHGLSLPPSLSSSFTTIKSDLVRLPSRRLNLRKNLLTFSFKATQYSVASNGAGFNKFGPRPSEEVKTRIKRLVDIGGMKVKIVLGSEAWL